MIKWSNSACKATTHVDNNGSQQKRRKLLVLLDPCRSTKTDWHWANLLRTRCGPESVPRSVLTLLDVTWFVCVSAGVCVCWSDRWKWLNQDTIWDVELCELCIRWGSRFQTGWHSIGLKAWWPLLGLSRMLASSILSLRWCWIFFLAALNQGSHWPDTEAGGYHINFSRWQICLTPPSPSPPCHAACSQFTLCNFVSIATALLETTCMWEHRYHYTPLDIDYRFIDSFINWCHGSPLTFGTCTVTLLSNTRIILVTY